METSRQCQLSGCERPYYAIGWCSMHRERFLRTGNTGPVGRLIPEPGAHLAFIESLRDVTTDECIAWPFSINRDGYGRTRFRGKKNGAHRAVLTIIKGDPPSNPMEAAHSCGNGHKACVNPNHLYWATRKQNLQDMVDMGNSHKGARNPNCKLTEAAVLSIYRDPRSNKVLANEHGVSKTAISNIKTGHKWGWLTKSSTTGNK